MEIATFPKYIVTAFKCFNCGERELYKIANGTPTPKNKKELRKKQGIHES